MIEFVVVLAALFFLAGGGASAPSSSCGRSFRCRDKHLRQRKRALMAYGVDTSGLGLASIERMERVLGVVWRGPHVGYLKHPARRRKK